MGHLFRLRVPNRKGTFQSDTAERQLCNRIRHFQFVDLSRIKHHVALSVYLCI